MAKEVKFTKEEYEKYNKLSDDWENEDSLIEYEGELIEELIKNYTVDEIDDEFENCFQPDLYYSFKESGESDRFRWKCGIIINSHLSKYNN